MIKKIGVFLLLTLVVTTLPYFTMGASFLNQGGSIIDSRPNFHSNPTSLANNGYTVASETVTVTANASLAASRLVYIVSNSTVAYADASVNATCHTIGITTSTIASGAKGTILLRGYYRDTAWSFTPGASLWLSTTSGNVTQTAPSGSGEQVINVGYAYTATIGYFVFDTTWIELP
jgi:hypothetical protein